MEFVTFVQHRITLPPMVWQSTLCRASSRVWKSWRKVRLRQGWHVLCSAIEQHHCQPLAIHQLNFCSIDPCKHSWISCSPTCMLRCRVSSSTWRPTTINMHDSIASALETRCLSVTMVRVPFECQGSFQLKVLCPMWWPWRMAEWCATMWTFWGLVGHTHRNRLSLTLPLQIWRLLYLYSQLLLTQSRWSLKIPPQLLLLTPTMTTPLTLCQSHRGFGVPVDHVDHQTT